MWRRFDRKVTLLRKAWFTIDEVEKLHESFYFWRSNLSMVNYLKVVFFVLIFSYSSSAIAEVFIVTSNADSGAGTLREALQKAADNGNAEKDFIYFNLPDVSETGRIILLKTELPELSSNLEVDGSTQPGLNFGISSAKVGLFYIQSPKTAMSGLKVLDKSDVFIGGLYLKNLIDFESLHNSINWKGIDIQRSKNIQIGAKHKGNVVSGFYYPLNTNYTYSNSIDSTFNIKLCANLMGIEADGVTLSSNPAQQTYIYRVFKNVVLGGDEEEGNTFATGLYIRYENNLNNYQTDILIKNNKIGVNYFANEAIDVPNIGNLGISISNLLPNGNQVIKIEANVIWNVKGNAIHAMNNGNEISIFGNYIGTNKTKSKVFQKGDGIFIYYCPNVKIGSNNLSDANYITNCNPVYIWPYSTVSVNMNSFYCTKNVKPMHLDSYGAFFYPEIKILNSTATSVSGTATPHSVVELFYGDECNTCSPQTYFASIRADMNGNWNYNGSISKTVIASATINNSTSDFTKTEIDVSKINITVDCDGIGSITGMITGVAEKIRWINQKGELVGTEKDLINVPPGFYKMEVENGACSASTRFYEIAVPIKLNEANVRVNPSSCNMQTGSVKGFTFLNSGSQILTQIWRDQNGKEWTKNLELLNVPYGVYTYYIKLANGCEAFSKPYIVNNLTGPAINQANAIVNNTACNQATGSITNIQATGTGTLKYNWKNQNKVTVGSSKDLINQPAGKYILAVTDETACGPVYSTEFEIKEINGITSDQSALKITSANCSKSNGSITGLIISGANQCQWLNEANQRVGNGKLDLTNQPSGKYTLIANNESCIKNFGPFVIDLVPPKVYSIQSDKVLYPSCGEINGSIEVVFKDIDTNIKYDWRNVDGVSLNINSNKITDLNVGLYSLYLIDENSCEQFIKTYEVKAGAPVVTIENNSWETVADNCGLASGSITGIRFAYENIVNDFSWFNEKGEIISKEKDLKNALSGNYKLLIKNKFCEKIFDFYIPYTEKLLPKAVVSDIFICAPTAVNLKINETADSYLLYDRFGKIVVESSSSPLTFNVSENQEYALTYKLGNCESEKVYFKVNIGSSSVSIPSAFTPNGDGVNDNWVIKGFELYVTAKVSLINRYGQEVFRQKGGIFNFDGTVNGVKLPSGMYYYIISLSEDCAPISGSVLIVN